MDGGNALAHAVSLHAITTALSTPIDESSSSHIDRCESQSLLETLVGVLQLSVERTGARCMRLARHAGRQQASVVDVV